MKEDKVKKLGPIEIHYREREQKNFYDEEAAKAWRDLKNAFAKQFKIYEILEWFHGAIVCRCRST